MTIVLINDLAYMIELTCKLYANETTLGDVVNDLSALIKRFVNKPKNQNFPQIV